MGEVLWCPDCGRMTLEVIETTAPGESDEYKEVRTCLLCNNMVHIFREVRSATQE